jgi:hypothetical protein
MPYAITMPIDIKRLCLTLGLDQHKLPKDFSGEYTGVELRDVCGKVVMTTDVTILTADRKRNRVLLRCPHCGEYMPSVKIYKHIDKRTCGHNSTSSTGTGHGTPDPL